MLQEKAAFENYLITYYNYYTDEVPALPTLFCNLSNTIPKSILNSLLEM